MLKGRFMEGRRAAAAMAVAALLSWGCGGGFDSKSGGDNRIASAQAIALGQPHTDRLSDTDGDNVDWKLFEFTDVKGTVRVDLYWDDPAELDVVVTLRDQFGARMFEWPQRRGVQRASYPGVRVREGRYYLELVCADGDSVYTVEVTDEKAERSGGDDGLRPE